MASKTLEVMSETAKPNIGVSDRHRKGVIQILNTVLDEVAERTRALGGRALGTLADFLEQTRLKERPEPHDAQSMIAALLSEHEDLIRHLREDSNACDENYHDKG